jgi:hypothetical protein
LKNCWKYQLQISLLMSHVNIPKAIQHSLEENLWDLRVVQCYKSKWRNWQNLHQIHFSTTIWQPGTLLNSFCNCQKIWSWPAGQIFWTQEQIPTLPIGQQWFPYWARCCMRDPCLYTSDFVSTTGKGASRYAHDSDQLFMVASETMSLM